MKNAVKSIRNKWTILFFCLLASVYTFAQDAGATTSSTETTTSSSTTAPDGTITIWYNAPWVWVTGLVVLVLILFLLFRGGGSRREVRRTTTTTTEINND